MCRWQAKLCDTLVTHGLYLSAIEMQHDKALYEFTSTSLSFIGRHFSSWEVVVSVPGV